MIKLTIDNNTFFIDNINYCATSASPLSSFTISGLTNIEAIPLNKVVSIGIDDSIFLKSFLIVSLHEHEMNNNIILFGKEENYDY